MQNGSVKTTPVKLSTRKRERDREEKVAHLERLHDLWQGPFVFRPAFDKSICGIKTDNKENKECVMIYELFWSGRERETFIQLYALHKCFVKKGVLCTLKSIWIPFKLRTRKAFGRARERGVNERDWHTPQKTSHERNDRHATCRTVK